MPVLDNSEQSDIQAVRAQFAHPPWWLGRGELKANEDNLTAEILCLSSPHGDTKTRDDNFYAQGGYFVAALLHVYMCCIC